MKNLVSKLKNKGYLEDKSLERAFLKIKRADFVPKENRELATEDRPLPIGKGQTISQPTVVALMLEKLNPQPGDKILDIGSGSGWTSALLAELVGKKGEVVSLEIIPEIKEFGERNVSKYNFIKEGRVNMYCSDGREGFSKEAPFDKILVSAALQEKKIPKKWKKQLKEGGVLVVPIKDSIYKFIKKEEDLIGERDFGFRFVPLVKDDE